MKTRMEKYYDEENNNTLLRQKKNESLYENIGSYDIDYKLDTNVTVLDDNAKDIDVEKIKKILDTKYNKEPKRRSIIIESEEEPEEINLDETREYDINAILERAREEKEVDYEKERLKKIRDTQYDILNSLELEPVKEEPKEEPQEKESNELMDLINTITARELVTKKQDKMDPLDLLTDLKGSDDTMIVGAQNEHESLNETNPIMSLSEAEKIKPTLEEKDLGNTLQFTQSDFDDFNDLKKEVRSSRALIYTIIILVSLILLVVLVIVLNKYLNLSLF